MISANTAGVMKFSWGRKTLNDKYTTPAYMHTIDQKFGVSNIFSLEIINAFIQQGCNKLNKSNNNEDCLLCYIIFYFI